MKIAIIGGGISGCTTYLSLKKHLPETCIDSITIYEAYSTPRSDNTAPHSNRGSSADESRNESSIPVIGGGLALAPNGLSVLSRLDPSQSLVQDIVRSGYAIGTMALKTKNGGVLAELDSSSSPGEVPEAFLSSSTSNSAPTSEGRNQNACPKWRGSMKTIASSRHALWSCLRTRVPDEDVATRRVKRVIPRADGLNVIKFADGDQVEVDLVIGADGLRSVTRRGMFANYAEGQEGERDEYEYGPQYEGLIGVGGFTHLSPCLKEHIKPGTMSLLFSGNGFFGYFPSSSSSPSSSSQSEPSPSPYTLTPPGPTLTWWSTYSSPAPLTPSTIPLSTVTSDLQARHYDWTDPIIQSILSSLTVENIYPTWTSPPLPTWEKHGVILVGDAAHALPSTSGQGASQGCEDAEALGLFLGHSITHAQCEIGAVEGEAIDDVLRTKKTITQAARKYIDLRKPRVEGILNDAKRKQNNKREMGWVGEKVMYVVLWVMGLFPHWLSRSNQQIVDYNVADEVEKVLKMEQEN